MPGCSGRKKSEAPAAFSPSSEHSRREGQGKVHPSSKRTWLADRTEIIYNKDYSAIRGWSLLVQCCAHTLHRQYHAEVRVKVFPVLEHQCIAAWSFFCPMLAALFALQKICSLNPLSNHCKYLKSIGILEFSMMAKSTVERWLKQFG